MKIHTLLLTVATTLFTTVLPGQAAIADDPSSEFNIVRGTVEAASDYPEIVSLEIQLRYGGHSFCGGTIIDDRWILTAGHCFERFYRGNVEVKAYTEFGKAENGQSYPTFHKAKGVYVHPRFFEEDLVFVPDRGRVDVALVELERPISEGVPTDPETKQEFKRDPKVTPVVPMVNLANAGDSIPRAGSATVLGRGGNWYWVYDEAKDPHDGEYYLDYVTLKSAEIPIRANCDTQLMICGEHEFDINALGHVKPTDRHHHWLYRRPASCVGDSGGPLFVPGPDGKRQQVGIVSHTRRNRQQLEFWGDDVCGRLSTWYSSISYLRPWIDHVRQANLNPKDKVPDIALTPPPQGPTVPPAKPSESSQPVPPPPGPQPSSQPNVPVPPRVQPTQPAPTEPPRATNPPVVPKPPVAPVPPGGGAVVPPPAGQQPAPPVRPQPVPPGQPPRVAPSAPPGTSQILENLPASKEGSIHWNLPTHGNADGSDVAIGVNRLRHDFALMTNGDRNRLNQRALLASESTMADALASGSLQAHAPLYLTRPNELEPAVLAELRANDVKEVLILGGEQAIHPTVEQALQREGIRTRRIAGADRTATATAIAKEVQSLEPHKALRTTYIARAFGDQGDETRSWADSVALGGLAASTGNPVLLTDSANVSNSVRQALSKGKSTTIIGGEAAVRPAVMQQIQQLTGVAPQRAAGQNRAGTAAAIAGQFTRPTKAIVIDGQGKDAWQIGFSLAGLSKDLNAPVLLTAGDTVPPETTQALKSLGIKDVVCIGSTTTCAAVQRLVNKDA